MTLVVVASVISFVVTEVDDLLALLVLFTMSCRASQRVGIVVGAYLTLFFVSASCALYPAAVMSVPQEVLGLSGFLAIAVGALFPNLAVIQRGGRLSVLSHAVLFAGSVALGVVLLAGAQDNNVAVYLPLFDSLSGREYAVMMAVFCAMQGLLCLLAARVIGSGAAQSYIRQFRNTIVPLAFIFLGVYLMLKNGTIVWLISLLRTR